MRSIAIWPALGAVLVLAACAQAPAPAPPAPDTTEADMAAIRANVEQFVADWNAGDFAATAAVMTEDILLMQPDGESKAGREAVQADVAESYDTATLRQSATVDEVAVYGDYGHALGTWRLDPKEAVGFDGPALSGKWFAIYKRGTDGAWRNWRWMWNQPPPAPAAAPAD